MIRPQGYAIIVDPRAGTIEHDTITCGHCQRIVWVKPGSGATVYIVRTQTHTYEEPGAFCRCCMTSVCLACDRVGTCTPWERQMERMESRDRFLRAVGVTR